MMSPVPAPKANLTTSYALSGFGPLSGQDETVLLELKHLPGARHAIRQGKQFTNVSLCGGTNSLQSHWFSRNI